MASKRIGTIINIKVMVMLMPITILFLLCIIIVEPAYAEYSHSGSVTSGGGVSTSAAYENLSVIGVLTEVGNSANYQNQAGLISVFKSEGAYSATLNATAGPNGSISPSGAVLLPFGTNQTFTINPNSGFHVSSVLVDGTIAGVMQNYTFSNVTANHTINAYFAVDSFTITAGANKNGSIYPSGSVAVDYLASASFTITPDSGYQVANVIVDGVMVNVASSYTFDNVTTNHSIQATFEQQSVATPVPALGPLSLLMVVFGLAGLLMRRKRSQ
jgi:hypothetical protein